jgi:RimJ/RimL family protein N-acetyltransferase
MEKCHLPEVLNSNRLLLKKHQMEEASLMFQYVIEDKARLSKFLPWPKYIEKVEDEESYIQLTLEDWEQYKRYSYSIFEKGSQNYLGNIGAFAISWEWEKCEIGYWILGKFEGKGFIREATATLYNALYEVGFNRVAIHCEPENTRSNSIPRALGFSLDGTLPDYIKNSDGEFRHMNIYSKVRKSGKIDLR